VILSTARLFAKLLPALRIGLVCDVGSLNGADSLRFRRALPRADIIAFEANPENYHAMLASPALQRAAIVTLPYAAAERDGEAEFFVVPMVGPESLARRGMSSLYQRPEPERRGKSVRVLTKRLDGILAARCAGSTNIALWIDAEGAAYEVLLGADGVLDRVSLIHVEVETAACIGATQKLHRDVAALLAGRGFTEIAADSPIENLQFNALYVRDGLPARMRTAIRYHAARQQLRRWTVNIILALCPARLRHYLLRRRQIPAAVPG
jgi:FkbM family methyltransferase